MTQVTLRFRHHQLGIDIDAHTDKGWQFVDLIPARNFNSIEDQWAFPNKYVQNLRDKGYSIREQA